MKLHGDPFEKRRSRDRSTTTDAADGVLPAHDGRTRAKQVRIPVRAVWAAAALILFAVAVVGTVVLSRLSITPTMAVADDSDPKVTGCADDAQTVEQIDVYLPNRFLAGTLSMRSSARCGTIWARFDQVPGLAIVPSLTIALDAYRPADGAVSRFQIQYAGEGPYGNQLDARRQCVYVEATVSRAGESSPAVRTSCRTA